jgi:DNA-binding MarR family transcriptional regulator
VVSGGDDAPTKSLGDRILAFLQKEPYKRFEQDEISAALGIPPSHKDSVYQALGRLFKRGLITKRPSQLGGKRKVYGLSNPTQLSQAEGITSVTDTPQDTPPPLSAKVSVQNAETVTKQELEITDTLTDKLTNTELTHLDDVQPVSVCNQELESVSPKLTDKGVQGEREASNNLSVDATVTPVEEELTPEEKKQLIEVKSELTGGILWKEGEISDCEMMDRLANLKKKAGDRLYRIACERLKDEDRGVLESLKFNH